MYGPLGVKCPQVRSASNSEWINEAPTVSTTIFNRKSYLPRVTPKLTQNVAKRPHQQNRGWRRASCGANSGFCRPVCCILH